MNSTVPEDVKRLAKSTAVELFHNAVDSDDESHSMDVPVASAIIEAAIMADRAARSDVPAPVVAGPVAVGWETEAEWELETRCFQWNENWTEEATSKLINDLWHQYCLAAKPKEEATPQDASERIRQLEADKRELVEGLRSVLVRDASFAPSGSKHDCGCARISRDTDREYEMGTCPHQVARALIEKHGGSNV